MKCNFCKDDVRQFDAPRTGHIVIHRDGEGHTHVHGDLEHTEINQEMIEAAAQEVGVVLNKAVIDKVPDEIVFHNKQRIGDMLVFTCAIRDFKAAFPKVRVNVKATAPHIWDHNPYIDRTLVATDQNTIKIGPSWLTNASNRLDWHFTNAYRISIEQALKIHIPQGESRPDIWFTQEEYHAPRIFKEPYWIICVNGEKGWGAKMYPFAKWQAFVDGNRDTVFVQIGTKEDDPPRLQGPNVIDWVGHTQDKETGIRDLYKLFLNAEGSIGLVSFHMHLSGALHKPAIVVAGAREPVHFTRYPGHAYLSTDGMLPCATKACWHCDINTCTNLVLNGEKIPKCVHMIEPEDITRALQGYYKGGRLIKGVVSEKPKHFKNVVKTPPPPPPKPVINTHGMPWGKGSLLEEDWLFIKDLINKHDVKKVLEFGAGLSTILLNDEVRNPGRQGWVTTYETMNHWIERMHQPHLAPFADIRPWSGKDAAIDDYFDLAFVDGPAGPYNRCDAMRLAAEHADIIVVHDGNTPIEKEHMAKNFPADKFEILGKRGRRCYFFVKKGILEDKKVKTASDPIPQPNVKISSIKPHQESIVAAPVKPKFVKIVSTAKGWGGQGRSITTIMRLLLAQGHKVEFIPFRNNVGSREFQDLLTYDLKDVQVTLDYSTIQESCDVLFVYADDYVWEFTTPAMQAVFENIGAERKIMMLNYRSGRVGHIDWTKGWDKYMFLNSTQETELLKLLPGSKTKVLPPCTDLTPFFDVQPDYENGLRIVRHSSQGDTKFYPEIADEIRHLVQSRADIEFHLLPGPSYITPSERVFKYSRTASPAVIRDFLARGNLFWYSLPIGYSDMGPRVIMEAMAAGLPVVADNWGGAKDRVTPETGWVCGTKEQHVALIQTLTAKELKQKGTAARERAITEFVPERWVQEIIS